MAAGGAKFDKLCRQREAQEKASLQAESAKVGNLQTEAQKEEEARLAELGLAKDHIREYDIHEQEAARVLSCCGSPCSGVVLLGPCLPSIISTIITMR